MTPKDSYNFIDSGIKSVSNLYNLLWNKVVKSLGKSSLSCKQDLSLSARAVISGTWTYSDNSGSSFILLSNSASSSYKSHLKTASYIF